MANFQLGDTQQVPYQIFGKDADGSPAVPAPGDTVNVSTSDTAMATVVKDATPAPGSLASGVIVGGTKEGTVNIIVQYQPQGGSLITLTDAIDIVGGPVSTVAISLGTPVAQTPASGPTPPPLP